MKFIKTFRPKSEGGDIRTHLEGIGDSYTLCGLDTAGDDAIHSKPPEHLVGKHRLTCEHCKAVVEVVREYLDSFNS